MAKLRNELHNNYIFRSEENYLEVHIKHFLKKIIEIS
jgi:hypothetical protein